MENSVSKDDSVHAMSKGVFLCQPKEGFPRDFQWTKANFVSHKRRLCVTCPKCLRELEKSFPIKPHEQKRKDRWLKKKAAKDAKPKNVAPVKEGSAQRVELMTPPIHKKEWCTPVLPIPIFSELRTVSIRGKDNSNADPVPSPEPAPPPVTKPREITLPPVQKTFLSRKQYFGVDVSIGTSSPEINSE